MVEDTGAAFISAGLRSGDRVGLFLRNGIDWVTCDLAAMSQACVSVPLYTRESPENVCHAIDDSGVKLVVVDTPSRWTELARYGRDLPALQKIWIRAGQRREIDDLSERDPRVTQFPLDVHAPAKQHKFAPELGKDSVATIVYTSGTTGPPKGVVLTHGALLWNARAVATFNPVRSDDVFFSILPLAHAFERTIGWIVPMNGGATVIYARSISTLINDLANLCPTVMLAVPRLFEKIRSTALLRSRRTQTGRMLMEATERIGWQRQMFFQGTGRKPTYLEALYWALIGKRVARKIRMVFGGRIRMILCGGAPLSQATARFMAAMEVPLIEGYGLTEAGPAVTGSALHDRRIGGVGRPLPGAEIKIESNGELLVRSPGVMKGYWNNDDATENSIDRRGWLHTGDLAEIRDDWVFITGRIKDILVLSTGENVNPAPIEAALLTAPIIDQVCLLGDGQPFCSALIVVNQTEWKKWAQSNGLDPSKPNTGKSRSAMVRLLKPNLADLPSYVRIRNIHIELEPWSPDNGLLTPTLKANRRRIADHYRNDLGDFYTDR